MNTDSIPGMTCTVDVVAEDGDVPAAFHPRCPAGPLLRRHDPSGAISSLPTTVIGSAPGPAGLVRPGRRPRQSALGCVPWLERCPLRQRGLAGRDRHTARRRRAASSAGCRPRRDPSPGPCATGRSVGRQSGVDPLSWPTAARPGRERRTSGPERYRPRHARSPRSPYPRRSIGLAGRESAWPPASGRASGSAESSGSASQSLEGHSPNAAKACKMNRVPHDRRARAGEAGWAGGGPHSPGFSPYPFR